MVDFGSILDRSRDALLAAVGQAASGANDPVVPPQDESLLSGLLPRSFGHDAGLDMDLDFAFNDAPARMADWRNVMLWMVALVVCVVIAASTNPNEASFRSYLTELSFRRHLVDIRTDDAPAELPSTSHANDETGKSDTSTTPVTPSASLAVSSHHASNGSDTPIAPFRFANHVSISLRTPTLYYKTLYLASVALTSPLGPPTFLSDPITLVRNRGHVQKERLVLYVGYLGHWVQLGIVPRRLEWFWRTWFDGGKEKEKRKKADRAGVMDMRAIQTKDEPVNKNATLAPPTKHVRRIGSNSDLSSTSHPAPLPIPTFPDSRRASIVSILPPSDTADTSPAVIALKADLTKAQDALSELKNQLLSHEQSVSDAHASLQATLDDLRTKRKEDDAERSEIKSKTKSLEEQKRQAEAGKREAEKKLKMAEGARDAVAAKIEGARKEMSDCRERIEASERAARTVTEEGARYVVETQEAVEVRRLEVGEAEEETRVLEQEVEGLTEKVKEAEERLKLTQTKGFMAAPSISPTTTANSAAQTAAAAAVANAIVGKNLAPEEEMMMMAAAYEVAAQEGYHPHQHTPSSGHSNTSSHAHGHQNHASTQQHGLPSGYTAHHAALGHGHGHGHGHNNSSWASQAAAYMAEAGMPSLDQSYTARPTYPGRQISSNTASAATGTAMGEGKRLTEMMAFDDFGPGSSASHDARDKRISGEGFGQVLGLAANRLSAQAHAHAEEDEVSEAELYGLDPASPNGGISTSFSANLLGQGLFNSLLGGDQTPTDATDDEMEDEGTTLEEALNFGPSEVASARAEGAADPEDKGENEHDSGDESGEDEWKSPHAEPRAVSAVATGPEVQNKAKRFSFSRLVPPTTSPLNPARVSSAGSNPSSAAPSQHAHIPTALPGLPSLPAVPASRRWFSGTMSASAENLHSFPYHAPLAQSSDSLASHTHTLPGGHAPGNNVNHANPGSGASTTTAGSLYESSPFAPSESERKKLMGLGGMWGQMGMGGLGKRFSTGAAHAQAIQGQGKDEGLGRSTSLDLASHARGQSAPVPQARQFGPASGNNVNANAQGAMTGTSPQSQQSWMARHLHLQSSLGNGAFSSNDSSNTASTQPVPITSSSSPSGGMRSFFGSSPNSKLGSSPNATFGGLSTSPSTRFGDALHSGSGVQATNSLNIGNDEGEPDKDKKDKERFKLFASLRKPSAAKLGSSPGAQSSTSSASNQG